MSRSVGSVELSVVRSGPDALDEALRTRPEQVLVLDAVTDADLHSIAWAVVRGPVRLACGSAGLANALAEVLRGTDEESAQPLCSRLLVDRPAGPVLVVAASRNPVTSRQLSCATQNGSLVPVQVNVSALAADPERESLRLRALAEACLSEGRNIALTATDTVYFPDLGQELNRSLGLVTRSLAGERPLAGLVLTGGDTALAVCGALEAHTLSLIGEVAPGIPLAFVADGPHRGLSLVTKAGGFGRPGAIAEAIRFLQGSTQASSPANGETPAHGLSRQ
jgi:uncharacterized protein YgbK (DUF1537 family)